MNWLAICGGAAPFTIGGDVLAKLVAKIDTHCFADSRTSSLGTPGRLKISEGVARLVFRSKVQGEGRDALPGER